MQDSNKNENSSLRSELYDIFATDDKEKFYELYYQYENLNTQVEGNTLLTFAIKNSSTKIAREILMLGIDLDGTDYEGNTAMMLAVLHSDLGLFKLLIDHDVDLSIRNQEGRTALDLAVEIKKDLSEDESLDKATKTEFEQIVTLLYRATESNKLKEKMSKSGLLDSFLLVGDDSFYEEEDEYDAENNFDLGDEEFISAEEFENFEEDEQDVRSGDSTEIEKQLTQNTSVYVPRGGAKKELAPGVFIFESDKTEGLVGDKRSRSEKQSESENKNESGKLKKGSWNLKNLNKLDQDENDHSEFNDKVGPEENQQNAFNMDDATVEGINDNQNTKHFKNDKGAEGKTSIFKADKSSSDWNEKIKNDEKKSSENSIYLQKKETSQAQFNNKLKLGETKKTQFDLKKNLKNTPESSHEINNKLDHEKSNKDKKSKLVTINVRNKKHRLNDRQAEGEKTKKTLFTNHLINNSKHELSQKGKVIDTTQTYAITKDDLKEAKEYAFSDKGRISEGSPRYVFRDAVKQWEEKKTPWINRVMAIGKQLANESKQPDPLVSIFPGVKDPQSQIIFDKKFEKDSAQEKKTLSLLDGYRNEKGEDALMVAAQLEQYEVCENLLEHGFYVDTRDRLGNTPLMHAVIGGNLSVVQLLLDKDSRIDMMNSQGKTALYLATQLHHLEVMKLLIDEGAKIGIKARGVSLLMRAAELGHLAGVKLLLVAGADPFWRDLDGRRARDFANRAGQKKVVRFLKKVEDDLNTRLLKSG